MEHEPKPEEPESGRAGAAYDALRRLEERLDKASEAAERLIAEAAAKATSSGTPPNPLPGDKQPPPADTQPPPGDTQPPPAGTQPPPGGWQVPGAEADAGSGRELELLAQVLRSLRDLIPPELQQKLAEALRELLLAIRALIDWYLERVEQRRAAPVEVQDIPIL
jgi:hypothetical protein